MRWIVFAIKAVATLFLLPLVSGCAAQIVSDPSFVRDAAYKGEVHFIENEGGWKQTDIRDLSENSIERVLLNFEKKHVIVLFDNVEEERKNLICGSGNHYKREAGWGYHPCNSGFFTTNATKTVANQIMIGGVTMGISIVEQVFTENAGYIVYFNRNAVINALRAAGLIGDTEWSARYAFVNKGWIAQHSESKYAPRPPTTPAPEKAETPTPPQNSIIPTGIDFGRYHALVIGNNAYRSLPRLKTAVNDATGVARLLREAYGFNVTVLTDATRSDILDALDGFRGRLTEKDNFLIYYAGHGWLDPQAERGYWQPIDAHEDRRSNWLSNVAITDTLKAIQSRHVIVVADSCYAGTMTRSTQRGIKVQPHTPDYLSQVLRMKSRSVLASGGLEQVIDSGGSGQHSVFAEALLDVLSANQGVIDGTQLSFKVREQVLLNARQTPQYSNIRFAGHEVGGDFLFVRRK